MDEDSCSKFIGSLTKYLQSLCHSYVEFESGVELVGHIYLNVDTAKKIDYVLNETVCKNGANVVKFTSNSYHAQPVEKQKAKKAAPEPSSKSSESATKKTADDDDVIIVGSEASRVRGSRSAQAGQRAAQAGPVQRGVPGTSGNSGDRLQQGPAMGTFRSPRGPNPRMAGPYGGGGHPRMGGAYQQGYRMTGQMPSSGAQPAYPGAGGVTRMRHRTDIPNMSQPYLAAQQTGRSMPGMAGMAQGGAGIAPGRLDSSQRMQPPHVAMQRNPLQRAVNTGRRASDPVDTDITFMREEYVRPTNQPDMSINPATHMQAHMPGAQQHMQVPMTTAQAAPPPPSSSALSMMTQRFGFPQQHQDQQHQQLQGAAHLPPRFPGPYSHNVQYSSGTVSGQAGGGPGMGAQAVGSAQDMGSGMVSAQQDVGSGMPGVGAMGTTSSGSNISPADSLNNTTMPTASQPTTSTPVGIGGGMPLPVTTHSIFDEHLPVGSSSTQGETAGNADTASLGTMSLPVSTPQGQMSGSRSDGGQGGLVIGQVWSQSSTNQGHGDSMSQGEGRNGLVRDSAEHDREAGLHRLAPGGAAIGSGDSGAHFNSESSSDVKDGNIFDILSDFQPSTSLSTSLPTLSALSNSSSASGSGSGSSSSSSSGSTTLQANFLGQSPLAASATVSPLVVKSGETSSSSVAGNSESSLTYTINSEVKMDPGQIGVSIATSVLQETTEAAMNEVPPMFLAPLGITDLNSGIPSVQSNQGSEDGNKRSGSSSSVSLDASSPFSSMSQVAGQDGIGGCSVRLTSQPHTSDYESGGDSTSTEKLASPHHLPSAHLRPLSISLVPVDTTSSKPGRERREATQKQNSQEEWVKDTRGVIGESSNSGFESEDLDDDDIDPSYQPPASRNTSKPKDPDGLRGTKRGKARQTNKSPRGKKRRTRSEASLHTEEQAEDANDVHSPVGAPSLPEHIASPSSPPSASTPLDFSSPPPLSTPPPPQQMPGPLPLIHPSSTQSGRGENLYKPGSFVLLQISRDSERSRTRSMQCPAEVIPTPKGQPEGIWVHTLHSVGSGLWQLPNEDQRVDLRVEPGDIKQILSNASVKIIGSKVFYKFEDRQAEIRFVMPESHADFNWSPGELVLGWMSHDSSAHIGSEGLGRLSGSITVSFTERGATGGLLVVRGFLHKFFMYRISPVAGRMVLLELQQPLSYSTSGQFLPPNPGFYKQADFNKCMDESCRRLTNAESLACQGRHGHQYTVKESKTVSASITRHSTATVLPQDVPAVTRLIFVRTDGGHF